MVRIDEQSTTQLALCADDGDMPPDRNMPPFYSLGMRWLIGPADGAVLVTDNETNGERAYDAGNSSRKPSTKDAFHRALCEGDDSALKRDGGGTKAALHYRYLVPAGGSVTLKLRF